MTCIVYEIKFDLVELIGGTKNLRFTFLFSDEAAPDLSVIEVRLQVSFHQLKMSAIANRFGSWIVTVSKSSLCLNEYIVS